MRISRLAFLAAALCIGGCAGESEQDLRPAGKAGMQLMPLSSFDSKVDPLLAQMTLDEKIGQMTQADQAFLKDISDISSYSLGSLLSGGDSDPAEGNSFEAWRAMAERYQAAAQSSRLKIPLLYGVDAVHGHSNVLGAVIFPHNIGLGCTRNPQLVEEISRITALEIRATGINWTFAPCVAVPRDLRWGRVYEGFSEDPELVAVLGRAATLGLQGTDLRDPTRVLACAKHYLGDGGTTWGTGTVRRDEGSFYPIDRGDNSQDEATFRRIHLPGYPASLEAGVGSIMPSYSSWEGLKMSGHKYFLTDVLKGELGFEGFLISDYNSIEELAGDYKSQIRDSVNAGMDMFMIPQRYLEFMQLLKELVAEGEVPMSRIDDAVRRILRVKFAMGLFDGDNRADRGLESVFGSEQHRSVARDAVRQSLVLLKNEGGVLPLSRSAKLLVAGRGGNDIGMQCGGWTITWQGKMGETTVGTTILEAFESALGGPVTYSADGTGAGNSEVAVVVVGEAPYAEFLGDREDLGLPPEDQAAFRNAKAAGLPVVVVVLSGRPVVLGSVIDEADAVLAAWWPGTEGQGIVDVLLGDYKPSGKLSFTWPRDASQADLNVGDPDYSPLFEFGYGLTYE